MVVVSRFAPAPTGFLHLGHVVNALHVWGITRALGGRVLLRIEDHDRQRSRPAYEAALLDDLEWLGFVPDDPHIDEFRTGPCRGRQSDRQQTYDAALARLHADGLVYACECTRSDLRAAGESDGTEGELRYPGLCASRSLPWAGRALRVHLPTSVERFDDLRHGLQEQQPFRQCGDMLVRDRQGNWSYQFAVTVDDMEQGVTLVIRGDDLLPSTGRQLQLARLLGRREPPRFLHHPLIMKSETQKLSKADRDTSVRDMRAAGASASDIIGRALHAVGFASTAAPLGRGEAEALIAARYQPAIEQLVTW
jgi:glutamyl-tRNA synthetase/glutamyl-Q tRNA(Asp) synthetase